MEQLRLHVGDLWYLAPELTLVITAAVLSLIDLILPGRVNRHLLGWLSIAGIAISMVFVFLHINPKEPIELLNNSYRVDDFANLFKLIILTGTALITFMSIGTVKRQDVPHLGEYYYLFLPAALGGMIMASSGDMITLYVGLELLSITSYVLVGMRKHDKLSNEGAFKYVVMGSISSAFILYGMSFLYGMSGTTNIAHIASSLQANIDSFGPLIYVSFFLMLAGFGFKIAAAPFHMWAPDVYQGAPTPVTAFLAVVSKGAAFAILFRIVYSVFFGLGNMDMPIYNDIFLSLSVLAAAAMIVGNTAALRQKNLKRLLAYSGVANAGYMLVPLAVQVTNFHTNIVPELIYYMIAYMLMNIGAFAVLMIIGAAEGHYELKGFAGLYYRAPFTAIAMVVFVLSLSGIPITGGFFGKLFILLGSLQSGSYWLAAVMMATSVVSFYYYFGFVRQMFMRVSDESAEIRVAWPIGATVWICAAATVAIGLYPQGILDYIHRIFDLSDLIVRIG